MEKRVIAIDLDPQANLTSAFLAEGDLEALWDPDRLAVQRQARALAGRVTSHAAFLFRGRPPLRPFSCALRRFAAEVD